jgi:tetraacyldisaccharide 4'-kinase
MNYLLSVITGERRGPDATLLRGALGGLAYLYAGGLKLFLLPYRLGLRKQARLPCPVISVGNLTVGGTGKTPMTQRICEFLSERGLKVCVLSRGYRGAHERGAAVVSTPQRVELDAQAAGDEACMLAKMLPGVPVVVGRDRRRSGALAWERFHPDVIVLDDGMQFYQLYRDLDIALVDALRPFDNGWTFPRGLLREPPSHLRRAGCVVITNADTMGDGVVGSLGRWVVKGPITRLRARLARLAPRAPIFTAAYAVETLRALDRSEDRPPAWLSGRRVASFCALGNPQGFEELLQRAGAQLTRCVRFPDHHEPTMGELNEMIEQAQRTGAEVIIVTEKDAVKLPPLGRPLPFYALVARLRLDDEAAFFARILKALGG